MADFLVHDHGSIFLFHAISRRGQRWIDDHPATTARSGPARSLSSTATSATSSAAPAPPACGSAADHIDVVGNPVVARALARWIRSLGRHPHITAVGVEYVPPARCAVCRREDGTHWTVPHLWAQRREENRTLGEVP
jgi:hypothetical protein